MNSKLNELREVLSSELHDNGVFLNSVILDGTRIFVSVEYYTETTIMLIKDIIFDCCNQINIDVKSVYLEL